MARRVPPRQPPKPSPITAQKWRACAGISVQIPMLHSRVYYFPQGYIDQASSPPRNLSPLVHSRPVIPCRVAAVNFFADPYTDEVFAKFLLHPLTAATATHHLLPPSAAADNDNDDEKIESYAKILTPSDANNGGGFSVPRFCADSVFPKLNFDEDPPVQVLSVTDLHGGVWEFRHIYRGTPRRHLLTTGWSTFVNSKKLVARDSAVFMKDSQGKLFVGIRRFMKPDPAPSDAGNSTDWLAEFVGLELEDEEKMEEEEEKEEEEVTEGFSRNGKGRVSRKVVAEAMELAARNMPFEVVYYPSIGWSECVVNAEAVDEKMSMLWNTGMRVKMARNNYDLSRMTWYQGTVSAVSVPDNGPWRGSPWRMLQITWDEPEALKNANFVSPWQVELLSATPQLHAAFPPTKKFRTAEGSGVFTDGEGDPFLSMTGFSNSTMGQLNQALLSYGPFPAGMQGVRHDLFSASSFNSFPSNNPRLCIGNYFGNKIVPRLNTMLTELNMGDCQSEDLSPDSRGSLRSFGTEFVGNPNCNPTKSGSGSFQLFGAIIQIQPAEAGVHGTGCRGDDNNEAEGIDNPLEDSLTYTNLLDRLDGQCQSDSTDEAYYS